MKNISFLLLATLLFLSACHKDDNPIAPIDQLPPATQTGAGTFGCLVNGEPFIDNSGTFNCFYQLVNGGYYFGIEGTDENFELIDIGLFTNDKSLEQGQTYMLYDNSPGNVFGSGYLLIANSSGEGITTNENQNGQLKITKFDFVSHTVSGIFSFDLLNPINGEIIEIREGRFDSHFTQ